MPETNTNHRKELRKEIEKIWDLSQELSFLCRYNRTKGFKNRLRKFGQYWTGKKPDTLTYKLRKTLPSFSSAKNRVDF